ncbi:MAG TPA: metallophosphoesterase [Candidatus Nitrosopolaris sp.]|nr:metallophosphoesterase [Candidatus Nitrosopolaris sp.]
MVSVRPLYPHPALLLEEESGIKGTYLVVSDLHIGFEDELTPRGVTVDSKYSLNTMLEELRVLIKSNQLEGVVLLGDIKSTVRTISKQEWNQVPEFFRILSGHTNIYIVPGNHDAYARLLIPQNINIMSVKGMVIEETLLTHGHTMPSSARASIKRIVLGHIHPVFTKCNSVINGRRIWLYLKVKREMIFPGTAGTLDIIIVPSFNKEVPMIHKRHTKSISPIINRALQYNAIEQALAVTLDGSIVADDRNLVASLLS